MEVKMIRDVDTGREVKKLFELGFFDEEFMFYGCAYVEQGVIKYRINESEKAIYDFIEQSSLKNLYPTSSMYNINRAKVPAGKKEKKKEEFRRALMEKLKLSYPTVYFKRLQQLASTQPNDRSYPLLSNIQKGLIGKFDYDDLQIFMGLVKMAFDTKLLTINSYWQLQRWVKDIEEQIGHRAVLKKKEVRRFSGFMYQNEQGELLPYFDAKETKVKEKRAMMDQNQVLATPIFFKNYWFDTINFQQIAETEKVFSYFLGGLMDEQYIGWVKEIKSLPPTIDESQYKEYLQEVLECCSIDAYQSLLAYGYRWNI